MLMLVGAEVHIYYGAQLCTQVVEEVLHTVHVYQCVYTRKYIPILRVHPVVCGIVILMHM
jgi:hypothetical protein